MYVPQDQLSRGFLCARFNQLVTLSYIFMGGGQGAGEGGQGGKCKGGGQRGQGRA